MTPNQEASLEVILVQDRVLIREANQGRTLIPLLEIVGKVKMEKDKKIILNFINEL